MRTSPRARREHSALLSSIATFWPCTLKAYSRMPPFLFNAAQVTKPLASAEGLFAHSLLAHSLHKRFWTLSGYENAEALRAFVQHPPDVRAVAALTPHMDKTRFVGYMVPGSQLLLRWDDAHHRLENNPAG